MTVGGSQQLRRFRIAVRDGATVEDAASVAGMSIGEARLHAADDAKNPPPAECFELLLTSQHHASPAPDAQPKENNMARRGRAAGPKPEEIKDKDFDRAVKLFKEDILPAQSKVGEFAQEQSTAYKAIKKSCGIQPGAARAAFNLFKMEDAKRDDWLRSFDGLIQALGISVKPDLVDMAEQQPSAPAAATQNGRKRKLATLPTSDGSETDLADAADADAHPEVNNVIGLNPASRAESLATLN